jgi:HlyD family secretion protein
MMDTKTDVQSEITKTLGISQGKGRRKKWKWIILSIVLLAVISWVFFSTSKNTLTAEDWFKTKAAARGPMTVTVTATGSIQPTNQVDVGSEQSGIVEQVEVTYNDRVEVGQVLARLDPSILNAQVMQYKANLESAKADLLNQKTTVSENRKKLERLKEVWELSGKKVPSQDELDAAEANLQRALANEASAKARVSQAQANLEAKETDLSKLVIYSPVNGIVLDRKVEPGQTVQASFQAVTLFKLAEDLTRMELHVAVDEADVGLVKAGQKATFTVDAYPDRSFVAEVIQVRYGAKTEQGVVTYETVLSADNSELLLRPGMTATADIVVKEIADTLLIPNAALRFSPTEDELKRFRTPQPESAESEDDAPEAKTRKHQKVWIVQNGKLIQISIIIGDSDNLNTEIKGGDLKPGDLLIIKTSTKGNGSVTDEMG